MILINKSPLLLRKDHNFKANKTGEKLLNGINFYFNLANYYIQSGGQFTLPTWSLLYTTVIPLRCKSVTQMLFKYIIIIIDIFQIAKIS